MSKTQYTFIQGADGITVYVQGNSYTVGKNHQNFNEILNIIKKGKSEKKLINLMDNKKVIEAYTSGIIEIKNGVLFYEGAELRNSLTTKLLQMMEEGFNISPLVNFLINLKANPSRTAQQELYDFLEAGNLPITPDGYFLAYKSVNSSYKDYRSNTFDNSIGSTCEMPRGDVCDNREITCAEGLHFAQKTYAANFGSGGHLMVLKINPADVVSIPLDYNNQKGRCARYKVIDEVPKTKGSDKLTDKAVAEY